MTHSIIHLSQLEGAHRLDAEYYQPEYFIDFRKGEWPALREVLSVCQYGISQAMTEEPIGIPIFRMNDIKDGFLTDDDVKYVAIDAKMQAENQLHENDILFNRVNSEEFVGRTGIFKLTDRPYVFASYLIRIRPKEESGIVPAYLNAFLNSAYGTRQIRKFARRAVNQANVNAQELRDIRIAKLPMGAQRKIELLVNDSFTARQEAQWFYAQAEQLLLRELGLDEPEQSEPISWVVRFSDVRTAERCDAEYFQPKYERLLKRLVNYGFTRLGDACDVRRGAMISMRFYNPESGTSYLRGADFSSGEVEESTMTYIDPSFQKTKEPKLQTGDIIFGAIGSVGTTALIMERFDGAFFSNNTGRMRISKQDLFLPECLQVLLRSPVGKLQFEKLSTQTAQPKISDNQIRGIQLPLIPIRVQQKIAELIRQSHTARTRAKQLFEEAKKTVEQLIEQPSS